MPIDEARIEQTDHGKVPADDGWFVLNLAEVAWETTEGHGTWCVLESPDTPRSPIGIGAHVLPPGETPGMYHWESDQEGFLVLQGECLLIVEGQERRMKQWDYFHCPPGTAHITVGAEGEVPCVMFMVGGRSADHETRYLADSVAARYGAAVEKDTPFAHEAYADRPPIRRTRSPWPEVTAG